MQLEQATLENDKTQQITKHPKPLRFEVDANGIRHATWNLAELKAFVSDPANARLDIRDDNGELLCFFITRPIREALFSEEAHPA